MPEVCAVVAAADIAREKQSAGGLEENGVKGLHVAPLQRFRDGGFPDFVQALGGNAGPFDLDPAPLLQVWVPRLACVSELPKAGEIGLLKLAHGGPPYGFSAPEFL